MPRPPAQGRGDRLKKPAKPKKLRLARERFLQMADDELASIPKPLRDLLVNVSIEVRDDPGPEASEFDDASQLLGLYDGPTREEMLRTDSYGSLPAKVFLYQRNMEDAVSSVDELRKELRLTLRHELAHHFGFDDADLERVWPEGA